MQQPNQGLLFSVFDRYKRYSPYDIKESIRKEVKGDLEKSFLTLGIYQLSVLHTSCRPTVSTLKRCAWQIWWWLNYSFTLLLLLWESLYHVLFNIITSCLVRKILWKALWKCISGKKPEENWKVWEPVTFSYDWSVFLQLSAWRTNICILPADSMTPWRWVSNFD